MNWKQAAAGGRAHTGADLRDRPSCSRISEQQNVNKLFLFKVLIYKSTPVLNRADPHWTLDFAAVWQKKHHTDPTGPQQHTVSDTRTVSITWFIHSADTRCRTDFNLPPEGSEMTEREFSREALDYWLVRSSNGALRRASVYTSWNSKAFGLDSITKTAFRPSEKC